ncbi:hypothetical protein [Winogradskyella damuponensis]|uniref:Lipoprotein n=1 Tax=Winogradskyella damuponensis TaxID=943939 RepID=A0ABP8CJQ3_9FLAO
MINKLLFLTLILTFISCNNDRPLTEFDFSNIEKITITKKGYNEIPNLANRKVITDSIKITNLINILNKSDQLTDGIISSNKGYIRLELQKINKEEITISNFYSNSNGQIIILEDAKGISRFRNDKFFEEVKFLLND